MSKKSFVFVVCGGDRHIHTLNFSLPYIRHFTKNKILVVTDSKRNSIAIDHDTILDLDTPGHFDSHQASIYLKTGLFKIVEDDDRYCYLDSDIIAMNEGIDEIFDYKSGPVTFASDHCTMDKFSPYALNCGCFEDTSEKREILEQIFARINPDYQHLLGKSDTQKLLEKLSGIKKYPLSNLSSIIRYLYFSFFSKESCFQLDDEYRYDKKGLAWHDKNGNMLIYDFNRNYKEIEEKTGFRFRGFPKKWVDENGKDIYVQQCQHLRQEIRKKFKVSIKKKRWNHWNGGVFLFDKESTEFMKFWHDCTMEIVTDSKWKTRDQGTLIAAAWNFGMQNQPRLPHRFNFIADYYNKNVVFDKSRGYSSDNWKTTVQPAFLHVYHEFGRQDWDIWRSVEETLSDELKHKIRKR